MVERKIQKTYIDKTAGIPVILLDVPMVKVYGEWTPDINYRQLDKALCATIAVKKGQLTGAELRFMRRNMGLKLNDFAKHFHVSHESITEWEKCGDRSTSMDWHIEKDIRLTVLDWLGIDPKNFKQVFEQLREKPSHHETRLRIPARYACFKDTKQLFGMLAASHPRLWSGSSRPLSHSAVPA
ncbi:MAG: hypothetical protein NTX50_11855 [Candidatus Sumerlaeota bacterium]|nr:hypothetical protein [Candidatus Sumerlaeota bacterium]